MSTPHRGLIALSLATALLLSGCAATRGTPNAQYDLGPAVEPAAPAPPSAPAAALIVPDVTGSAALDSQAMFYRLNYADPLQARAYANSRWAQTPLQMLTQRLKSRIAQAGVKVLGTTDASAGVPILRIEADDFSHSFDSLSQNSGQVALRASLFRNRVLVDQRTFVRKTASTSADAGGGVRALAASTDAAAADIVAWLATLQLRKE